MPGSRGAAAPAAERGRSRTTAAATAEPPPPPPPPAPARPSPPEGAGRSRGRCDVTGGSRARAGEPWGQRRPRRTGPSSWATWTPKSPRSSSSSSSTRYRSPAAPRPRLILRGGQGRAGRGGCDRHSNTAAARDQSSSGRYREPRALWEPVRVYLTAVCVHRRVR